MSNPNQQFVRESQKERWVKYGANVALSMILVVLLAGFVMYLAQRFARRIDTTATGMYSLKPQTVNLIKDLKQKVKLVSLYSAKDEKDQPNPYAGPVQDLLEEYARKSKNIEYEVIDPIKQPTKTDSLVSEAIQKYGGAVKAYKDFTSDFSKTLDQLTKLTSAEATAVADIQTEKLGDDDRGQTLAAVINTVRETIPQNLSRTKERTDRVLKSKFPDYKALTDQIKDSLDTLSQTEKAIIKFANQLKGEATIPEAIRNYLNQSPARHEEIQKLADDTIKKINGLGELKVGELQQAIKGQDLILALGENDWRVINVDQVWIADTRDIKNFTEGQEIKPRFAGEQAVTTAILSLSSGAKPKVVFVRPGGAPLTTPGFPPFQRGGPFSEVAQRLKDYNFDVLEKDLSGMYAMQAQMQGQPAEPEPSDDEIKDAVWIFLDIPSGQQMGPSPAVSGPKLAAHLNAGGAALVLALPDADKLTDALKDYGIDIQTDATIVHDPISAEVARSNDWSEDVQREPFIFVMNKYGDHLLTEPLKSLDSVIAQSVPVRTSSIPGVKVTPLLPVPQNLKFWGERDAQSIENGNPKFDQTGPNADVPPPLWVGAVVEKDKSRLVVIGNLVGFTNQVLSWPDKAMLSRGILVSRFPGNGELFTNSVFWLAKMEPMIAISPAAMEVSRISDMSDLSLNFWRVGVLLILLPGLVLSAGIWMYFARRD